MLERIQLYPRLLKLPLRFLELASKLRDGCAL
jgi:hypothetical protein